MNISELKDKVLTDIIVKHDEIIFVTDDNRRYKMYHQQSCCEDVYIESIVGDITDLLISPILLAEESINDENPLYDDNRDESTYTWTFYKLATIKGYVDIRWYGASNGYYSESVDFIELSNN